MSVDAARFVAPPFTAAGVFASISDQTGIRSNVMQVGRKSPVISRNYIAEIPAVKPNPLTLKLEILQADEIQVFLISHPVCRPSPPTVCPRSPTDQER